MERSSQCRAYSPSPSTNPWPAMLMHLSALRLSSPSGNSRTQDSAQERRSMREVIILRVVDWRGISPRYPCRTQATGADGKNHLLGSRNKGHEALAGSLARARPVSDPQGRTSATDKARQLSAATPHPLTTLKAQRSVHDSFLNTGSPEIDRRLEFHKISGNA